MIKLFFGNDTVKVRREALSAVESSQQEGLIIRSVDLGNYEPGIFENIATESSLFGETFVYLLDNPSDDSVVNLELLANLKKIGESQHLFVVIERLLKAEEKKQWNKYAEVEEFKTGENQRFNTFMLADALAKRDRKSLWLVWSEARLLGIAPEELVGILWWQLKSMRLANLTSNALESGMKDYPYQKAKRALVKFEPKEPERLSQSLLEIYHQSRLSGLDLDLAIERWLLRI